LYVLVACETLIVRSGAFFDTNREICYIYPMTIEQTIEVPANRRISFDLPFELPVGKTKVELTLTPLTSTQQTGGKGKIHLTKLMIDEMLQGEVLQSLTGLLRTETSAEEIRAERLKKYDNIA